MVYKVSQDSASRLQRISKGATAPTATASAATTTGGLIRKLMKGLKTKTQLKPAQVAKILLKMAQNANWKR